MNLGAGFRIEINRSDGFTIDRDCLQQRWCPLYGARDKFEEVTTVNLADNLADLIFMRFLYFYE